MQTKSYEYGLYSLLLMNYFNSYTEKLKERLSNFAKEVFMTEPFKVRDFIVTQKKTFKMQACHVGVITTVCFLKKG